VLPGAPTGIQVQITVDQFINSVRKGNGPGGDERLQKPEVEIDGPMASLWSYYTYTEGGQTKGRPLRYRCPFVSQGAGWVEDLHPRWHRPQDRMYSHQQMTSHTHGVRVTCPDSSWEASRVAHNNRSTSVVRHCHLSWTAPSSCSRAR
jgi:hypothetical protein